MRGNDKEQKNLIISGNIYLLYEDENYIPKAKIGDILMYLNTDARSIMRGMYYKNGHKGFFKAEIFDSNNWCLLDTLDFFPNKENYFSKSDICIDIYKICKEILCQYKDIIVYKSYRCHYTINKYERDGYKGKKGALPHSKALS